MNEWIGYVYNKVREQKYPQAAIAAQYFKTFIQIIMK